MLQVEVPNYWCLHRNALSSHCGQWRYQFTQIMSTSFSTLITNFAVTCKPWRPKNVLDHFSQKYGLFFVFKSKACPCLASLVRATEVSCPRNLGNDRTTQKYGREENVSKVNTFVFCRLLNFLGRLCFPFIIFFAVDSYSCFFSVASLKPDMG